MTIREFRQSDIPRVEEIFRQQGFEYSKPDWEKMIGGVLEDETGVVRIALLNRPTVEAYALVDQGKWAAPGMKATQFERLDQMVIADLKRRGYTDEHCWTPPACRAFARRLQKFFGWGKSAGPDNWLGLVREL